jgi:putative membrane protein
MQNNMMDSLAGLFGFGTYFCTSLVFVAIFCFIYCAITPYNELKLIREGKTSAAISFGGALTGFVLPLHSAITHSVGLADMLIWAAIAMSVQFAVFGVIRLIFRDLVKEIENNHVAAATLLASCSVSIGILNAACMTY